jgi:hypothetical protein
MSNEHAANSNSIAVVATCACHMQGTCQSYLERMGSTRSLTERTLLLSIGVIYTNKVGGANLSLSGKMT